MKFVGIDLHKKSISVCVVDQQRQVLIRKRFACAAPDRIVAFFKKLELFQAVMEATSSYEWLFKLLEPLAERILLAHPKKLRVIPNGIDLTRFGEAAKQHDARPPNKRFTVCFLGRVCPIKDVVTFISAMRPPPTKKVLPECSAAASLAR